MRVAGTCARSRRAAAAGPPRAAARARRGCWRGGAAITVALLLVPASLLAQFTSFNDRSKSILEGNWQSCRDSDGQYSERIFDGRGIKGIAPFELHMGPYHEFALFLGVQDGHRDHNAPEQVLSPHVVDVVHGFGKHTWDVAGVKLEVVVAGGSRNECESWFVTLTRSPHPPPPPIQLLRLPAFCFAPCLVTFEVRAQPVETDRELAILACDRAYDGRCTRETALRSSIDETLEGQAAPKLYRIPWRLDAGEYVILATIGPTDGVRASASAVLRVRPLGW